MAYLNVNLITDALREINVINEVQSASAEQGQQSLTKLNQFMEGLKENDIDFGWFEQSDIQDSCPVPDWARMAVTAGLAIVLAPQYGATLSPELFAKYDSAFSMLQRKSIAERLDNADMSHLPDGSGHFGSRYDINTDST
ncbi:MAG: hypothetical protein GOVbin7744_35 [Prokaryotic dsDNA virus sp.]|nr:MAG: hypothetical protein GOVbin7744_35 [Prokaryotic dsDNA virus sp.]|tara:strand:+ start:18386 stop:18805 length:420 start_codon:yes stop_codon:yes gene_type:complete